MAKIAGRQTEIGIGIEATAGTAVAATDYFKWDSFSMQSMADKIMLSSARGIRNKVSNSLIARKYGKGDIEFFPSTDILPYALSLALGSRSSGAASGESAVYDHTYTIQNANASMKTATILVKQGGTQTERYTNCVVDTMDFSCDKDLLKCKLGIIGNYPDTSTLSPSYVQDTLFSKANMSATFGTSVSNAVGTFGTTTATTDATAPVDSSIITIGTTVYTFKSTLTNSGNTPYEVLIGVSAAVALDNLQSAINGTSGAGTTYGFGTLPHPDVLATTNTNTTQLIKARVSGTAANSIVTLASSSPNSHITWAGATLNSGTPGTGPIATPLVQFSLSINNNVQFDDAFLSGSAKPIAGGFIAGPLEIKGSYTLQFADVVELGKYQANTNNSLVVTIIGGAVSGVVPTPEKIQIKLGDLVLTKSPIEYNLDGLVYIKQEFTIQYDATDLEITMVVTNTNAGTNY